MRCDAWRVKALAGTSYDSPGLAGTRRGHASRLAAQRSTARVKRGLTVYCL